MKNKQGGTAGRARPCMECFHAVEIEEAFHLECFYCYVIGNIVSYHIEFLSVKQHEKSYEQQCRRKGEKL